MIGHPPPWVKSPMWAVALQCRGGSVLTVHMGQWLGRIHGAVAWQETEFSGGSGLAGGRDWLL